MTSIEKNEVQVNNIMININKIISVQGLLLLILNFFDIFRIPWNYFWIIFISIPVLTWTPIIYYKLSKDKKYFKYMQVIMVLLLSTINYAFNHSYALFFWAIPLVLSALYFDTKLVKTTIFLIFPFFALGHIFNVHYETVYYFTPDRIIMSFGSFIISLIILGILIIRFTKKSNEMLCNTQKLMDNMSDVLNETDESANEVSSLVENVALNINQTHGNFKEISTEMDDISRQVEFFNERIENTHKSIDSMTNNLIIAMANVNKIYDEANSMSELSNKSADAIIQSEDRMNQVDGYTKIAKEKLEVFNKRFNEISDATDLIKHISSETSLLSLNASIEAARAGEAGKGFAVVANEVKKLASDSEESVESIEKVINNLRETVKEVVDTMNNMYGIIDFSISSMNDTSKTFSYLQKSQNNIEKEIIEISKEIKALEDFGKNIQADMKNLLEKNKFIKNSIESIKNNTDSVKEMSNQSVNHINNVSEQCVKLKSIGN